jgi:hypothetical protein
MAPRGHRGADPQSLRGPPIARRADHHFVNKLDREARDRSLEVDLFALTLVCDNRNSR